MKRGQASPGRRRPAASAWVCRTIMPPSSAARAVALCGGAPPGDGGVDLRTVDRAGEDAGGGAAGSASSPVLPEQALDVIRLERFVWVASPNHVAWENDPLPVALFEPGCAARMNVLQALGDADRSYRCTYSSASLLGLIAVVQAGLAVAGLASAACRLRCASSAAMKGFPCCPTSK